MAVWIFDLDDTLYSEYSFLCSAYRHISSFYESKEVYSMMLKWFNEGENTFSKLEALFPEKLSATEMLKLYRCHFPDIELYSGVIDVFESLKNKGDVIGVLTDGRSKTQRNKIDSLGLTKWLDKIVISEEIGSFKPALYNYEVFEKEFQDQLVFTYIADNPKKDFITPNRLGWNTIGIRDAGFNIHSQIVDVADSFQPKKWINSLGELNTIINEN